MRVLLAGLAVIVALLVGAYALLGPKDGDAVEPELVAAADGEAQEASPLVSEDARARRLDLVARVQVLEREVRALRSEVARLGGRNVPDQALTALEADGPLDGSDPLQSRVHEIIEDERQAEQERRMQRRRDRVEEMNEERLDELAQTIEMSDAQREQIGALWLSEVDRLFPLVSEGRQGERPWREIREAMETIREETDQQVQDMLDPEQYQQYQQMRPRGPGGRRGGRPPGPPP